MTRPVVELADWRSVEVGAGETLEVTFEIRPARSTSSSARTPHTRNRVGLLLTD